MINLLPSDDKRQLKAARVNVILLRYNLLLLGSVLFLVVAGGVAFFYLTNTKTLAQESIEDNLRREGGYAAVKTEADTFRKELSSSKAILDEQVSYAKAALNIAKLLPDGTSLNELKLNQQSFAAPLILTVNIRDEQAAAQLIRNFESSSLFSGVTKGKISVGTGAYPYTMEVTVTMSKDAAK